MDIRVGNGFDVHAFDFNISGNVVLGGIEVECDHPLKGHSDADVVIHAIIDSLLGAAGMGDIGDMFPDTDPKYKGIDSAILLKEVLNEVISSGFEILNIDITVLAQKPKLHSYKLKIKENLSSLIGIKNINVKATTTEQLGFIGRKEGIACSVSSLVRRLS